MEVIAYLFLLVIIIIGKSVMKGSPGSGSKENRNLNQPRKEAKTRPLETRRAEEALRQPQQTGRPSQTRTRQTAATQQKTSGTKTQSQAAKPAEKSGKATSQRPAAGSTMQALKEKARTNAQTTIMDRAKANTSRLEEDTTLQAIEEAHGHKETQEKAHEEHSRNCQTLRKDPNAAEISESLLGSTEDLMVKGFDGNMSYGRDFVGEAMDMLAAISSVDTTFHADLPTETPESKAQQG